MEISDLWRFIRQVTLEKIFLIILRRRKRYQKQFFRRMKKNKCHKGEKKGIIKGREAKSASFFGRKKFFNGLKIKKISVKSGIISCFCKKGRRKRHKKSYMAR